jgi:hypothetical protein
MTARRSRDFKQKDSKCNTHRYLRARLKARSCVIGEKFFAQIGLFSTNSKFLVTVLTKLPDANSRSSVSELFPAPRSSNWT